MRISATDVFVRQATLNAYGGSSSQTQDSHLLSSQGTRLKGKDSLELSNPLSQGDFWGIKGLDSTKGSITIHDIKGVIARDKSFVQEKLQKYMDLYGISKTTKITLTGNSQGRIKVTGEGKNLDRLEKALNDDKEVTQSFNRMSGNASLVKAFEEHQKFAEAYREDPEKAVNIFAHLFDNTRGHKVSLVMENGEASIDVKTVKTSVNPPAS